VLASGLADCIITIKPGAWEILMLKKVLLRKKRHFKIRKKTIGTAVKPRLNVFRSLNNIYAQIIDDSKGHTLIAASTLDAEIKTQFKCGGNKEAAKFVGQLVAKRALENGIEAVIFDRGGYKYHGRVAMLADGAREAGLKF
jgi:large subunit ribosomal protein L18